MRSLNARGVLLALAILLLAPGAQAFSLLGTKWEPGSNTASTGPNGTDGAATWSLVGAGFVDVSGYAPGHSGATQLMTALGVPGYTLADYEADIQAALDLWASVSSFSSLGQVADGNVNLGASEASGGALGDIRIAAYEHTGPHEALTFLPGTEALYGPGGTIAGDVFFDINQNWVDDPFDLATSGNFDFFTVALHQLGHALGLGHSNVAGSVMEDGYFGARRELGDDDIAAIQALYGMPHMPEPDAFVMFVAGILVVGSAIRRMQPAAS